MLALTEDAAHTIEQLLENPDVPEDGGLRIAAGEQVPDGNGSGATSLQVTIAAEPIAQDLVLENEGARVFLEPSVVPFLDDKILDVSVEGTETQFSLHQAA